MCVHRRDAWSLKTVDLVFRPHTAGMRALGYAARLTPPEWLEGAQTTVFKDMNDLPGLVPAAHAWPAAPTTLKGRGAAPAPPKKEVTFRVRGGGPGSRFQHHRHGPDVKGAHAPLAARHGEAKQAAGPILGV